MLRAHHKSREDDKSEAWRCRRACMPATTVCDAPTHACLNTCTTALAWSAAEMERLLAKRGVHMVRAQQGLPEDASAQQPETGQGSSRGPGKLRGVGVGAVLRGPAEQAILSAGLLLGRAAEVWKQGVGSVPKSSAQTEGT